MTQSKRRRYGVYALSLMAWPALSPAADDGVDAQRVLPTVVVTAQKTKQTLEQVPASVSTIDGDFIKQIGALDVDTLQNYSANVSISMGSSSAQVSVRGLGTPNSNQASDPSVGTVIDGVFYGRSSFATAFLDDLDRFEVLRGPQGTLFGKNSTAGLLNITTRAPEQDPSARVEVLTAGYGQRTYRPMLNLPMMPGVAVRFSGNYSNSDGVLYNTYLNRDERNPKIYTSRLRISVEPVAGWRGDLEGFVSNQYQNFNIFKITHASPAMTSLIQQYDPNFDQDPNSHRNSSNIPSREQGRIGGANLTLNHDLGGTWGIRNLDVTSITAYGEQFTSARDLDADFTPIPFIRDTLLEPSPYRQFSQELRFAGDHPNLFGWGHGFSFVTGAYYFNSKFRTSDNFQIERLDAAGQYFTAANAGDQPAFANASYRLLLPVGDLISTINALNVPGVNLDQAARVNLNQRDKAYALFGQAEHFFLPQWAVIAGLRLGLERKDGLASSQSNPLPVIGTIPSTPANVVISQVTGKPVSCGVSLVSLIANQCNHVTAISDLERDFSPKLGIKWSPDKNRSAYATFSRGYKSGGFNGLPLSPDNLQFGPERATSYEIGAKARLLGGSMNVSASAFSTDFDNLQISSFQNNSFVILNAAAARSRGFEVDTRWLTPVVGLSVLGSVGFADARYTSYPNAPAKADSKAGDPGTYACPSASGNSGGSLPTNSGSACQDLSGKPLAFAPRWTASLVPSYSRNIDALGLVATFALDVLYRDSRYLDVDDDPRKLQPSTTILNARAIVGRPDDNWTISVAAQNITNQVVFDQVVGQPLAPGNFAAVRTDRGRYYTAALTLNFN